MMRRLIPLWTLLGVLLASGAQAAKTVDTADVPLKDDRGARVTLTVPLAIHRGANHFRLWGPRPLTLHSRERRKELFREALLDVATRASLSPRTSAWDDLQQQLEWLRATSGGRLPLPPIAARPEVDRVVGELTRRARSLPGYGNLEALGKALGTVSPQVDLPDAMIGTLQLRALATDEAEQRLLALGKALRLEERGVDPALRDAYAAAVADFQSVRRDLWTALSRGLQKNQGRLLLSAVREALLSPLGAWAVFGYLGWRGVESVFSAEQRGQSAICAATLARRLQHSARESPDCAHLALYAEYAAAFQLTEALKQEGLMALKPAGGRTAGAWQIEVSERVDELRKSLSPSVP